jgi:hypothetical protein
MMSGILGGDVASLLIQHRALVDDLASVADVPEITRLRFALAFPDDASAAKEALAATVAWRSGEGQKIVDAAAAAVAQATSSGTWDNAPARESAPHAAKVNKYITPAQILTTSNENGDFVFCIRASGIDDKALMSEVSVEEMTEFFLYKTEVHSLVADARSLKTGRLCKVITANDLSGLSLNSDANFRNALSASSKEGNRLYPSLGGPTMILNLPIIVQALVGLFKPLFPKPVQQRLKFEKAKYYRSLKDLTPLSKDKAARESFLAELDAILAA